MSIYTLYIYIIQVYKLVLSSCTLGGWPCYIDCQTRPWLLFSTMASLVYWFSDSITIGGKACTSFWVPISGYLFLSAYFWVPISECLFLGAYFWVPISECLFLGAYFWVPISGCLFLGTYFWVPVQVSSIVVTKQPHILSLLSACIELSLLRNYGKFSMVGLSK